MAPPLPEVVPPKSDMVGGQVPSSSDFVSGAYGGPGGMRQRKSPTHLNSKDLLTLPRSVSVDGTPDERLSIMSTPLGRLSLMGTPITSQKTTPVSGLMAAGGLPNHTAVGGGSAPCSRVDQDFVSSVSVDEEATPASWRRRSGLAWHEDNHVDYALHLSRRPTQSPTESVVPPGGSSKWTPRRHVSLAEPGFLPWFCCQVPGLCFFGMIFCLLLAAAISQEVFFAATAALTLYVAAWTTNLAIFSAVGAWSMRREAAADWHAMVLEALDKRDKKVSDLAHIVILPNYKEDEGMLQETLEHIGRSPLARSSIRIVLGMEEREGPTGKEKAERLVSSTRHLFADIFATYHPAGRAGEVAGKSSNTQWAYRCAIQRYSTQLADKDPALVFLSVGDADTLWNQQYFDALSHRGLTMPPEEAVWTIWQPPLLLFRNLFAVPAFTRLSGYGTMLFELAGLANQRLGTHLCFSSYSLTLALVSHHKVAGWDADVIAEDHHMFCKCMFGDLWDSAERQPLIRPRLRLCPIYLPAEGYLVESSEGYVQSCIARFQQARRHSQGVAELGYTMLQYLRLLASVGPRRLSVRSHAQVLAVMWKMHTVHIANSVQAFSLVMTGLLVLPDVLRWLWSLGLAGVLTQTVQAAESGSSSALGLARGFLFLAFGPLPPVAMLSAATIFIVVRDTIEGRYTQGFEWKNSGAEQAPAGARQGPASASGAEDDGVPAAAQAAAAPMPPVRLSRWRCFVLAARMQHDMMCLAEPTVVLFGMVPCALAAWSLLVHGSRFDYIVAAKPNALSGIS